MVMLTVSLQEINIVNVMSSEVTQTQLHVYICVCVCVSVCASDPVSWEKSSAAEEIMLSMFVKATMALTNNSLFVVIVGRKRKYNRRWWSLIIFTITICWSSANTGGRTAYHRRGHQSQENSGSGEQLCGLSS